MGDGNKNITFTNIMGQWKKRSGKLSAFFAFLKGRINQLGGVFINGRPLPPHIRYKIVEMANHGIKPCQISRQLRVSHGAVSKILNRYAETGSVSPGQIGGNPRSRLAIQAVEKHILALKAKRPNLCASELRSCLIEQEICSPENAPTVSSINRHIRSKKLSFPNSKETKTTPKNRLNHSIEHILGLYSDDNPETSEANYLEKSDNGKSGSAACDENSEKNGKVRRNRTSFTSEQLEVLEAAFEANTYPDQEEREQIAIKTNLSEDKIMTWFSNRRARCRKNFAITGGSPYLVRNLVPVPVGSLASVQQSQLVPLFSSQMNLLSYPAIPSPVKFHDPSAPATPINLYPQYATI